MTYEEMKSKACVASTVVSPKMKSIKYNVLVLDISV